MFRTPVHVPKLVPWTSWDEWKRVKQQLFADQFEQQQHALNMVNVWRARGRLPLSIESSAELIEIERMDRSSMRGENLGDKPPPWDAAGISQIQLRLIWSMAMVRLVNGLVDPKQTKTHAISINKLAEQIQLPRELVDIRHDSCHNHLPTLPMLRYASEQALIWLRAHYWTQQEAAIGKEEKSVQRWMYAYKRAIRSSTESSTALTVLKHMLTSLPPLPVPTLLDQLLCPALLSSSCLLKVPTQTCRPSPGRVAAVHAKLLTVWKPALEFWTSKWSIFPSTMIQAILSTLHATSEDGTATDDIAAAYVLRWRQTLLTNWANYLMQSILTTKEEGTIKDLANIVQTCLTKYNQWSDAILSVALPLYLHRLVSIDPARAKQMEILFHLHTKKRAERSTPVVDIDNIIATLISRSQSLVSSVRPTSFPLTDCTDIVRAPVHKSTSCLATGCASSSSCTSSMSTTSSSLPGFTLVSHWPATPIGVMPGQSKPHLDAIHIHTGGQDTQQQYDNNKHDKKQEEEKEQEQESDSESEGHAPVQPLVANRSYHYASIHTAEAATASRAAADTDPSYDSCSSSSFPSSSSSSCLIRSSSSVPVSAGPPRKRPRFSSISTMQQAITWMT